MKKGRTTKTKVSLAKSTGKIRQAQEKNSLSAIQKVQLYRKQKDFLTGQAEIFEKKSKSLKVQIKDLEKKIKDQKETVVGLIQELEVKTKTNKIERPEKEMKRTLRERTKGLFKLNY